MPTSGNSNRADATGAVSSSPPSAASRLTRPCPARDVHDTRSGTWLTADTRSMTGRWARKRRNRIRSSDANGGFPSNEYNDGADYGRGSMDVRHTLYFDVEAPVHPARINFDAYVQANSGPPFNITVAQDLMRVPVPKRR